MRIDNDYLKSIMDVFLEANEPTVDLNDFPMLNLNGEADDSVHQFVFHFELLDDQGFIEPAIETGGIGLQRTSHDYSWSIVPLRLTAKGHDFASALNKPGVLQELKTTFRDSGPTETVKAVFGLAGKAFDRKLKDITED